MQDQAFRFQISVEAPTRVQNLKWHGRLARAFAAPRDVRPVLRSKALDRSVLRVWSNRSLRSGCLAGVPANAAHRRAARAAAWYTRRACSVPLLVAQTIPAARLLANCDNPSTPTY